MKKAATWQEKPPNKNNRAVCCGVCLWAISAAHPGRFLASEDWQDMSEHAHDNEAEERKHTNFVLVSEFADLNLEEYPGRLLINLKLRENRN